LGGAASQETGTKTMIPEPDEYLSFLMGADAIADEELSDIGVRILSGAGTPFRGLLVPEGALPAYQALIRKKLTPGYWNDILGRQEILFVFKLTDGTIAEFTLSESTLPEVARLCSSLNNDPVEKTSNMAQYLGANPFYRDLVEAFHSPHRP
jgi:hypothetical protein